MIVWRQIHRALSIILSAIQVSICLQQLGCRSASVQPAGARKVLNRHLQQTARRRDSIVRNRPDHKTRKDDYEEHRAHGQRKDAEREACAQLVEIQVTNHALALETDEYRRWLNP